MRTVSVAAAPGSAALHSAPPVGRSYAWMVTGDPVPVPLKNRFSRGQQGSPGHPTLEMTHFSAWLSAATAAATPPTLSTTVSVPTQSCEVELSCHIRAPVAGSSRPKALPPGPLFHQK